MPIGFFPGGRGRSVSLKEARMSDKRTTPDPAEGDRRRKRPAPTIDLKATDVSGSSSSHETNAAPPPPGDERLSAEESERVAESRANGGPTSPAWAGLRQMLFAGLGGAGLVALVLLGGCLGRVVPARHAGFADSATASVAALNERLAKIESSISKNSVGDPGDSAKVACSDHDAQ